jgi:pyruvate/2-oxoglutarate dehydrogenase complex dihydrolipoamide acyltransferase (E2) component
VRAIAKANNLDISTVEGSGKSGRVMKEDVLRVLSGKVSQHMRNVVRLRADARMPAPMRCASC